MTAPVPPQLPDLSSKSTFLARTQALFVWLTTTLIDWIDATATAMSLNSTNSTSTTSLTIGLGSKSLTVGTGKSYQGGMYVVMADTAAPSTNSMTAQVTSYNSGTGALVVNSLAFAGAGIKTDWIISQSAKPVDDAVLAAITAASEASVEASALSEAAAITAESARDAAIIQAGVYTTEVAGRAAVADGVAFKVQGSGDIAAYEYRRVNAGTVSTLIATYPSAQAVLKPSWTGKKNGWLDPFFRNHDYLSHSFAGRDRWWQSGVLTGTPVGWTKVSSAVFNAFALRRTAGYNQTTYSGPAIWLDEIDVVAGDTITAYVLITGSGGGTVYSAYKFVTAADVDVTAASTMQTALGVNNITASATPQFLRVSVTVPATAAKMVIYPYNLSGSTDFDLVSCWVFKGGVTEGPDYPTLDDSFLSAQAVKVDVQSLKFDALGFSESTRKLSGAYLPFIKQQSVLGDGEMDGDADYGLQIIGYYTQVAAADVINAIQCRMWASNSSTNVEWRLWVRTATTAFNMDSTPTRASGTVPAGSFPVANTLHKVVLDTPLALNAGDYVFVMFKATDNSNMNMRRWVYNAGISPARHGFPLATGTTWNTSWGMSSPTTTFGQPAVKLLLESEELRTINASQTLPELVMPPYIFGVQGRECNVYLDNLHLADSSEYLHDITSAGGVGTQQQERWTWTPSGALASGSLVVNTHDKRTGSMLATKTANQRAAASSAGTGLTKKVIVIGDSLVGAGAITQTLLDISAGDVMTVTMLGTQGTAPNKHEGRGGWAISTYVTTGSPFYISGAVNFPQYLTNNSIATPDWVLIHLGINDVFGQTSDAAANSTANAAFVNLDILIASIKAAGAGVNVGLMIPTPGSKFEDAFGNNYATGQTGWRFKRNILIWARQLIATYAGQEANRIYLIPSNTALDTVNNMSVAASAPVNSRSLVSSTRQSNGVHPSTQGYQQIADAVWAFLKFYA